MSKATAGVTGGEDQQSQERGEVKEYEEEGGP